MFRILAQSLEAKRIPAYPKADCANAVTATHPLQLSRWLDEMWARGGITGNHWDALLASLGMTRPTVVLGDADAVVKTRLDAALLALLQSGVAPAVSPNPDTVLPQPFLPVNSTPPPPIWEHLFYAYLLESTGIVEILGEVVRRYAVGETLAAPNVDAMVWARNTEELFFRDAPLFGSSGTMTSQLRPDGQVNRRNAYWRMFGMDLPHPAGRGVTGQPWKTDNGSAVNSRFLELWNELLRQVWLGIENDRNSSGANPTDANYIGHLCQTLGDMLQLRRRGGMLSREEFSAVCMLGWFHLTVDSDTAVVRHLHAEAGVNGHPVDRLARIATAVGMSPSRQAHELFELADQISTVLWMIELGFFNQASNAEMLYRKVGVTLPTIANTMNGIIDQWQSATGERVKDLAVTARTPAVDLRNPQPTILPGSRPTPAPAMAGNGHRPSRSIPRV